MTVGRASVEDVVVPDTFTGWSLHRRRGIEWAGGVDRLFAFVGEVRRLYGVCQHVGAESDLGRAMQNSFLHANEGRFQVPVSVRCERLTVVDEDEAEYVRAMAEFLTTDYSEVGTPGHPPIFHPRTWHVTDVWALTIRPGEAESAAYRAQRLDLLLSRVSGRYVTFAEFALLLRDRDDQRRWLLDNLTSPEALEDLMYARLSSFPPLPATSGMRCRSSV